MKNTWLIGASQMAVDYAQVLKAQEVDFVVIGRSEKTAEQFYDKTGVKPITGGLDCFLNTQPEVAEYAIVAVGIEELANVTLSLLVYGIRNILVEKPGALNLNELLKVSDVVRKYNASVFIAYNRRFYSSVLRAKELIKRDGGVLSFNFEFTEWGHVIEPLRKRPGVKENWFFGNSTHVVDLAFYLGGFPLEMSCYTSGHLEWHTPAIFSGAGITDKNALFSYCANWKSPGRWSVEILTAQSRYIFRPMEKLQVQKIGSVSIDFIELDESYDLLYKPGLFLETKFFLGKNTVDFVSIERQIKHLQKFYSVINDGNGKK